MSDPTETQVDGDHYMAMPIQPVEFIHKNNLGYCEGNIIKYTVRHQNKGGARDIRKIIHYAQLILKYHYGESASE